MKTHLKALAITISVLAVLIVIYFLFTPAKPEVVSVVKVSESKVDLPQGSFKTLDGKKLNLQQFAGKIIIFNFWASWCAPCIEEVPSLVSLVKADPNIVIIAVSGDQNKDDIHAFLKSFPGFNKPPIYVVQENMKALMDHFKVDKLPESFIFSPKGEMVKKISGTINWHTPESIEYFKVIRSQ
ncbi:MAG: TlpA family protein disulfide reductase [Bdellovibrionaceae bacterium]|nr:TlpA family protein disulfide reductase [Pseudobdellovibrionaceae bacterium]